MRSFKLLAVAALLVGVSPAHAQQSEVSERAQLEADCRLAAQVLIHGQPANKRDWAMAMLPRCPIEGARAAARLWEHPATDSVGLYRLRRATQHTRDQQIVDALMRVAQAASNPLVVRKIAMLQLFTYLNPADATSLKALDPANDRGGRLISRLSHPVRLRDGPQPLRASYREELIQFYRSLAESDADPEMRYAAGVMLRNAQYVPVQ